MKITTVRQERTTVVDGIGDDRRQNTRAHAIHIQ